VDPETIAVLSLGSSKVVTFHGGPLPWILDRSGYYEEGVTNKEEGLRIQPISSGQQQSGEFVKFSNQTCMVSQKCFLKTVCACVCIYSMFAPT